jgi:hypothetical protein
MRNLPLTWLFVLLSQITYSQSCLPDGIEFTTQEQIDSYQVNYPGCTEIEGGVRIAGAEITSLEGLSVITSIGGFLYIIYCPSLSGLAGLENLTYVGGDLGIGSNSVLTSLEGLENIGFVGGTLFIIDQDSLTGLQGLEGVTAIEENLEIESNDLLTDLAGIANLTSVGDQLEIYNNSSLSNLTGLENMVSIGHALIIQNNSSLQSIIGVENVDGGSLPSLWIYDNTSLSECAVESVCESLAEPGGNVYITNNAEGCNNEEEVLEACAVGVDQLTVDSKQLTVSMFPNPAKGIVDFRFSIFDFRIGRVMLKIYDVQGREMVSLLDEIKLPGECTLPFDVSTLQPGIYFYRLTADGQTAGGKLVVVR